MTEAVRCAGRSRMKRSVITSNIPLLFTSIYHRAASVYGVNSNFVADLDGKILMLEGLSYPATTRLSAEIGEQALIDGELGRGSAIDRLYALLDARNWIRLTANVMRVV